MEKYLHVTCIVRQQNLYDLLHALEEHKVGNVGVRAVSRILNGASEEPTLPSKPLNRKLNFKSKTVTTKSGLTRKTGVRLRVREAMEMNVPFRYWELAHKLKINQKSMASAMHSFMKEGIVRKVEPGVYMRIKEDE